MKFMENFIKLMLAFGIGLLLVLLAMPKVIPFLHKMKFGQVEREEGLESHCKVEDYIFVPAILNLERRIRENEK